MVRLQCKHCGHEWEYKGKSEFYTNCPICHYMVNVKKGKEEDRERTRILIECEKCGYSWEYSGKRDIARCPECNHRNHIKKE
jgi:hypothetical protein